MELSDLRPPRDLPAPDARTPALALRGLTLLVGVALSLAVEHGAVWIVLGVLLSLGAALAPDYLLTWALIAVLAIGQLERPEARSWQPFVLLAGVHLLHCLGLLSRELPWRSWIQPAVFIGPLRRYVAIQVPSQIVALLALEVLVPARRNGQLSHVEALSLLGALALAGLALLLSRGGEGEG